MGALWEIYGAPSSGKALPVTANVLTPDGWVEIGNLAVGDEIMAPDGTIQQVLGVYPQGKRPVKKVIFNDGSSTICDTEHLWSVRRVGSVTVDRDSTKIPDWDAEWRVLSLDQLVNIHGLYGTMSRSGFDNLASSAKWEIPSITSLSAIKDKDLPIDPYVMGVALACGKRVVSPEGGVDFVFNFTQSRYDCYTEVCDILGKMKVGYRTLGLKSSKFRLVVTREDSPATLNFVSILDDLGLDRPSKYRCIPSRYMDGSDAQRRDLLAGILDMAVRKPAPKFGAIEYESESEMMVFDVIQLTRSLAGFGYKIDSTANIRFKFNPFIHSSFRKTYEISSISYNRRIVEVQDIPDHHNCVCIRVSHESGCFVVEDYVVTHNSSLALSLAADLQRTTDALLLIYETEQSLDEDMLVRTQVDVTKTLRVNDEHTCTVSAIFNHMLETIDAIEKATKKGDEIVPVILLWDSVAATAPETLESALESKRGSTEAGITSERVAAMAMQLSTGLKYLKPVINKCDVLAIFINQIRATIGALRPTVHTMGGYAFQHMAEVRTEVSHKNPYPAYNTGKNVFTKGEVIVGAIDQIEMKKNKVSAPFKRTGVVNMFSTGPDAEYSSLLHAIFDLEMIDKPVRNMITYREEYCLIQTMVNKLKTDRAFWQVFKEDVLEAQRKKDEILLPKLVHSTPDIDEQPDNVGIEDAESDV